MIDASPAFQPDRGLGGFHLAATDITWVAGLVEGEGTFTTSSHRRVKVPTIAVRMTDRDVIEHLARLWHVRAHGPYTNPKRPHHKPAFMVAVRDRRAVAWMMTLYLLLGVRRRARIRELLAMWRTRPDRRTILAARCARGHALFGKTARDRVCRICRAASDRRRQARRGSSYAESPGQHRLAL